MKLPLKWLAAAGLLALLALGVGRALSSREAARQALEAQQAAQRQPSVVDVARTDLLAVRTLALQQTLQVSGSLRAVRSAFVKARAAGELQGLSLREGDTVRAGQQVARIDATENQARLQQAQQQAEAARAQVEIAQRSLDNNKALVDQGFISRTALDTSLNNLAAAQATYKAAQAGADVARKALDDTVLRSPLSGQIAQRLAQDGERVAIDSRVLEVVDLSALELEAALGAAESVAARIGQTAQLTLEGRAEPIAARLVRINPSAVAGNRAVMAYFAVSGGAGLRQGLFAEGTLALGQVQALAVPLDAVRTDKPQPYLQTVADGTVRHQTVSLGARGSFQGTVMVEVRGVPEGAQVLAASAGALRDGTLVKIVAGKP